MFRAAVVTLYLLGSARAETLPHGTLKLPKDYETWSLAGNCITSVSLYSSRNLPETQRQGVVNFAGQSDHSEWIEYSTPTPVEVLNKQPACAQVRIIKSGETGWIAAELLGPSPEEEARIAAERSKAKKAEEDRRAAIKKAEGDRQAALAKLPVVNNGAETVFIGSDRRCAEQFIEAMKMEGLEKRKRLADLISYGCGFLVVANTRVVIKTRDAEFAFLRWPTAIKLESRDGCPQPR